jgi:hypothetical protein
MFMFLLLNHPVQQTFLRGLGAFGVTAALESTALFLRSWLLPPQRRFAQLLQVKFQLS